MGTALLKIKIMPESPESDLDEIESNAIKIIDQEKGVNPNFERESIAFGLTALIAIFSMDESLSTDNFQEKLSNIPKVKSTEIIDFRRAFG